MPMTSIPILAQVRGQLAAVRPRNADERKLLPKFENPAPIHGVARQ